MNQSMFPRVEIVSPDVAQLCREVGEPFEFLFDRNRLAGYVLPNGSIFVEQVELTNRDDKPSMK